MRLSFLGWLPLLAATYSGPSGAETAFLLTSRSDTASYGILVQAADTECRLKQVAVDAENGQWRTRSAVHGNLAVVRMGRGFPAGDHLLTLSIRGCEDGGVRLRRVVLAKRSPDHGWRAEALR